MLLRHFMQHIKDQNWFAVILDLFIVILGVFIGIQVDSWNVARKERSEEVEYLGRLYDDIQISINRTLENIDFMKSHAALAGLVMKDLRSCHIPDSHQTDFANGLYQLGKTTSAYFAGGTLNELRSTGKLHILSSRELHQRLNEMEERFDYYDELTPAVLARTIPHVIYVDSHVYYNIRTPTPGTALLNSEDVVFDLDSICKDERFYHAISAVRNYTYDQTAWLEDMVKYYNRFRDIIAVELDKHNN